MARLRANDKLNVGSNNFANATFQRYSPGSGVSEMDELPKGAMDDIAPETSSVDSKGGGLLGHMKEDFEHTKAAMHDAGGIISGAKAKAAADAGAVGAGATDTLGELRKTGEGYLERMGRGSKTLGGAKVGAYMVGASMLTDMLNPFDDD